MEVKMGYVARWEHQDVARPERNDQAQLMQTELSSLPFTKWQHKADPLVAVIPVGCGRHAYVDNDAGEGKCWGMRI